MAQQIECATPLQGTIRYYTGTHLIGRINSDGTREVIDPDYAWDEVLLKFIRKDTDVRGASGGA